MKKNLIIEILIWFLILFTVLGILIFCQYKFWIEPNTYTILFKDINGITKGSMVRFMGMNAGYVRKLKHAGKDIEVEILITNKDIKIPEGTVARVEFYGLVGSKSIELMPPDNSCDVGILSHNTTRLHEIVDQTKGLVDILEIIQRLVKGLNAPALERAMYDISILKSDTIQNKGEELTARREKMIEKGKYIAKRHKETRSKINQINSITNKLNKFINKNSTSQ